MLCFYFFIEAVLQDVAKNNPIEKQIDAEIPNTLKHAQHKNSQKGKCKVYRCKLQKIALNYKLQLLASGCQKQSPVGVL